MGKLYDKIKNFMSTETTKSHEETIKEMTEYFELNTLIKNKEFLNLLNTVSVFEPTGLLTHLHSYNGKSARLTTTNNERLYSILLTRKTQENSVGLLVFRKELSFGHLGNIWSTIYPKQTFFIVKNFEKINGKQPTIAVAKDITYYNRIVNYFDKDNQLIVKDFITLKKDDYDKEFFKHHLTVTNNDNLEIYDFCEKDVSKSTDSIALLKTYLQSKDLVANTQDNNQTINISYPTTKHNLNQEMTR